jgi:DNA-binding PadR family transcriptional regulator
MIMYITQYSEAHIMIKQDPGPDVGSLETEMNRGFLHILVLALLEKNMYGYSMVKHIETLGYRVEENTLYPLLRRLEKNGWIASRWDLSEDRPRKFYAVTPEGRALRASLLEIWKTQDRILDKIAKENAHVQ